ncbi:MAG: DUF4424 family protein [Alphaproteobacteria bacterium]|nr:DUF4424 family protein [Alphaproteobacteria bacterium]MBV9693658.1 DUF4424 family protein [Alphaproteobacteria bacterium]
MRVAAFMLFLLGGSLAARADDSSAALGAGGLVLTRQGDIRMAAEDLYLSPTLVKVRYEFVNDGPKDVDTIVAFPLPDIDVRQFWFEPLGTTLDNTPNFMGFALSVDGRKVAPALEERALLDGRDVTAEVTAAGLPINIAGSDLVKTLDALPAPARKALAAKGLIESDAGRDIHPHWIARTRFWWHQVFPAGKTVIVEHRYQPVTGQSFFGLSELTGKEGAAARRDVCIDSATTDAIRAKLAKLDPNGANGRYLKAYRTDFVLTTANNWKGPIGHFRLTLDKLKPDNVLSLCWDGELKKTGATTFEAVRTDFAPARDIRLLVLQ